MRVSSGLVATVANVKTVNAIEFDNHLETLNTSIFGSVLLEIDRGDLGNRYRSGNFKAS